MVFLRGDGLHKKFSLHRDGPVHKITGRLVTVLESNHKARDCVMLRDILEESFVGLMMLRPPIASLVPRPTSQAA